MKVQIISYENRLSNRFTGYELVYSTINSPQSFDEFDLNIISLQEEHIWRHQGSEIKNMVNCVADLKSLQSIIQRSKHSNIIVAFPTNTNFKYYYSIHSKDYQKSVELKNVLDKVNEIIKHVIPDNIKQPWQLQYENTTTIINEKPYDASFYFDTPCKEITVSKGSEKPTTIGVENWLYFTTLKLSSPTFELRDFLKAIGLEDEKTEIPEWLVTLNRLDDEKQHQIVSENNQIIITAEENIKVAKQQLVENQKYKSILVNNGNQLVSVVFEILEKILDYNLSEFKDDKREDFLIKKDSVTFIGEIKGITSNVKSENVAQVERHYQSYMDQLQEKGLTENVKPLLIINPFRTKELSLRDEVHQIQINLAKRYGSLIITTEILLGIFEKFLNGEITVEKIISVFSSETGLADIKSF